MRKIGITGQNGFIGNHLYQKIKLLKDEFTLVEFNRTFFDDDILLDRFVKECDVIIHLAALNRHNDPETIYKINIELVNKLVLSLTRTSSKAQVILSSSTQEEKDNIYGRSKRECRELLKCWAEKNGNLFTGMIIPNVFGPFGKPFYNSVIATFSHQLANNEVPVIEIDGSLKLIYVGELVEIVLSVIRQKMSNYEFNIPYSEEVKVSQILSILNFFKEKYFEVGEIPRIKSKFELNLFNTFRSYIKIEEYFPRKFVQHKDERGAFVEIARHGISGQTSFSTTVTGITRGNHFHTRKIERFAVIKGKALIQLRQIGTDFVHSFYLDGNSPAYVDMPIWYTHNITNIGDDNLYTIFWINEPYNKDDPDTYFEIV